jgi:putative two-component system response regulator
MSAGRDIPLSARIAALCDVYDALVNKRLYKEAVSHEIARDTVLKERGRHFNPVIEDAFLKTGKKSAEIHRVFQEKSELLKGLRAGG